MLYVNKILIKLEGKKENSDFLQLYLVNHLKLWINSGSDM